MKTWLQAQLFGALTAIAVFILLIVLSSSGVYDVHIGTSLGFPIVAWYLVAKKQLQKTQGAVSDKKVAPEDTQPNYDLIADYGEILEKYAGATAVDIDELPAYKDNLKSAIKVALKHTTDTNLQEVLRAGYVELSKFQIGVGPIPIDMTISTDDKLSEFMKSNPDMTQAPTEMKEAMDKMLASVGNMTQGIEWQEKVAAESVALLDEVKAI